MAFSLPCHFPGFPGIKVNLGNTVHMAKLESGSSVSPYVKQRRLEFP